MHPEISDLFFNAAHPAYDALYATGAPSQDDDADVQDRALADAEAFAAAYPLTCEYFDVTAGQLAADFMQRL